MKKNLVVLFLSIASTSFFSAQVDFKAWYKDQVEPGEVLIWANYQHISVKTADGQFVRKTFYPEKRALTHRATYADKRHKILNGPYKEWYDNGKPWMEGTYKNDQREGEWLVYTFDHGTVQERGNYVQDKREGQWVWLDTTGRVVIEMNYVAGKLHGEWKMFNDQGELSKMRVFENGEMTSEQFFPVSASSSAFPAPENIPFLKGCENEDKDAQKACSDQKMLEGIFRQIKYPMSARLNNVQGTAVIRFVIEKDGTLSNITTMRGICEDIEKECIRVVNLMPAWNAGTQNGEPVRVQFSLPIKFKLE